MTMRSMDTRFWSDVWVRKLNALDRYLFIYLLTNEHTSWCGIYELDLGMMAFESGVDKEDLTKSMLPRLSPKVIYIDGWVCVPNWLKYHMSASGNLSPQQKKGYEEALAKTPERIRKAINDTTGIPYRYPIGGVSASASAFSSTSASITADAEKDFTFEEDEDLKPHKYERKPKDQNAVLIRQEMEKKLGRKFTNPGAQQAAIARMIRTGYTKEEILSEYDWALQDKFWSTKGVDFLVVATIIHKEHD